MHRWARPVLATFKSRQKMEIMKMKPNLPKPNPRSGYLEWNLEAELYAFGKRVNEDFDPDLLRTAFTFRSYVIKEESRQKDVGIEISENQKDNIELIEQGLSICIH